MIGMARNPHEQIKAELLNSTTSLFSGSTSGLLLSALKSTFPLLSFALIVNWIPEQVEDIYWVLIDSERIAILDVPRLSGVDKADVPVEVLTVHTLQKRRLSVETRRKLEVALELMLEQRN
ncbi:hypothetical protein [Paraherbaspirillum soli]|uniref:Uncharacterized protein n=1 Tax=Paraherbaspirillum soli TaxID=631222 RepID=A0ABW0MC29_9BURK